MARRGRRDLSVDAPVACSRRPGGRAAASGAPGPRARDARRRRPLERRPLRRPSARRPQPSCRSPVAAASAERQPQLWVTRDEGAVVLDARCRQARPRCRHSSARRTSRRATAGASCSRSTVSRARRAARLVLVRQRHRGDRSVAEYRLRDGDVDWWDFLATERSASPCRRRVPGAVPPTAGTGSVEPAVRTREGWTRRAGAGQAGQADSVERVGAPRAEDANVFVLRTASRVRRRDAGGALRIFGGLVDGLGLRRGHGGRW